MDVVVFVLADGKLVVMPPRAGLKQPPGLNLPLRICPVFINKSLPLATPPQPLEPPPSPLLLHEQLQLMHLTAPSQPTQAPRLPAAARRNQLPRRQQVPRATSQPAASQNFHAFCALCKSNGEPEEFWTSHKLHDENHNVTCPILRRYTCPNCGTQGNHTKSYCPQLRDSPPHSHQRRSTGNLLYKRRALQKSGARTKN